MTEPEMIYLESPPSRWTFSPPKIRSLMERELEGKVLNLFAGETRLNHDDDIIRNDLNEEVGADYHFDALEVDKYLGSERFNTIILDPPWCYDEETEILTENGWKFFRELSDEKVATLNPRNNRLEFQKPLHYLGREYSGRMIRIKSQMIDLLITPNHDLWVQKTEDWKAKRDQTKPFKKVKAGDVNRKVNFKKNANWEGKEREYFTIPSVEFEQHNRYGDKRADSKEIPMKDWLRFLGIYLSEGSVDRGDQKEYRIRITQEKQKKNREIIERWLDKLPFNFTKRKEGFVVWNKQLFTYLERFGKTKEKYIPSDIKSLSSDLLEYLIEGLMLGDGCLYYDQRAKKPSKQEYYSTSSRQLADDFDEIILKTGRATTFSRDKEGNFICSIIQKKLRPKVKPEYISKEKYRGKIYDVEVPNGIIYVRRNGETCWSGNSTRKARTHYEGKWKGKFTEIKDKIIPLLEIGGKVITWGFSSVGMSQKRGFKKERIYLICHGGDQNDSICLVERKITESLSNWLSDKV